MIYIIRHGESLATRDPSLFGRTDPTQIPLTTYGYQQSVAAGEALAAHIIMYKDMTLWPIKLYYSPHLRIKQSAAGFLTGFNDALDIITISEDTRIREREHGLFDGVAIDGQKKIAPEIWQKLYHGTREERFNTRMPNGESLKDLQARCTAFMKDIRPFTTDHHIVVITHGGLVAGLQNSLWNRGVESWIENDFSIAPVGTVIAIDPDGLSANSQAITIGISDKGSMKGRGSDTAFYPDLRPLTRKEKKYFNSHGPQNSPAPRQPHPCGTHASF